MLAPLFTIDSLLPYLQEGTLVLVPNQRLAAKIHQAYDEHQCQQGLTVWPSPIVYALEPWLQSQRQSLCLSADLPALTVLSRYEEKCLWEKAIEETAKVLPLIKVPSTAEAAQSAHRVLVSWQYALDGSTDFSHAIVGGNEDSDYFFQWQQLFLSYCDDKKVIAAVDANAQLIDRLEQGQTLSLNVQQGLQKQSLLLLGFDDISPLYQRLFSLFKHCEEYRVVSVNHRCYQLGLESEEQQLIAAAEWAKAILNSTLDNTSDSQAIRIGIIDPLLTQRRGQIERCFREVFEADYKSPLLQRRVADFNFSTGTPLAETPIIATAFKLLQLGESSIELDDLQSLLSSPFIIAAEEELFARQQLILLLLKREQPRVSIAQLRKLALQENTAHYCPKWGSALLAIREVKKDIYKRRLCSEWEAYISHFLALFFWPGQRNPDSVEYQQMIHWYALLDEFRSLDHILGLSTYTKAKQHLQRLASQRQFQAETEDAPIQILGTLEGAGLHFTHLWVLSQDDSVWPPKASPSALIPIELQRQQRMPHCDAEREFHYAETLQQSFIDHAQTLIFSYAESRGDIANRPSPLLRDINFILEKNKQNITLKNLTFDELIELEGLSPLKKEQAETEIRGAILECIDDSQGPMLSPEEQVKGGASIFSHQSACPFRAFAIHRLQAKRIDTPQLALTAKDRGIVLHRAMEFFWLEMKNSDKLHSLDECELQQCIERSIDEALLIIKKYRPDIMTPDYSELEKKRLFLVLNKWLEVEKQRPRFSVIAVEKQYIAEFESLTLTLKVDRIDELHEVVNLGEDDSNDSSGSKIIIDYKTGQINIRSWLDSRPTDPQLPLYAVVTNSANNTNKKTKDNISAIALGKVDRFSSSMKGVADRPLNIDGVTTIADWKDSEADSWQQATDEWRQILSDLAAEFIAGNAKVEPLNKNTCQYCHLQALCRIGDELDDNLKKEGEL